MPAHVNSNLLVSNDRLRSRMRENRQSGSESGEPQTNAAFLPLSVASDAPSDAPGPGGAMSAPRVMRRIRRVFYPRRMRLIRRVIYPCAAPRVLAAAQLAPWQRILKTSEICRGPWMNSRAIALRYQSLASKRSCGLFPMPTSGCSASPHRCYERTTWM
jgi:hypothetical protein